MRREFAFRVLAILAWAALPVACLLPNLDDLSGSSADAGPNADAKSDTLIEARADADEGGLATNSCGALLFGTEVPILNPSFEVGCANGWSTYAATPTEVGLASKGDLACQLCFVSGVNGFFVAQTTAPVIAPGDSFELVACVRSAPGKVAPPIVAQEVWGPASGGTGATVLATPSYAPIRVAIQPPSDAGPIGIAIRSFVDPDAGPDTCFIVDDVRMRVIHNP